MEPGRSALTSRAFKRLGCKPQSISFLTGFRIAGPSPERNGPNPLITTLWSRGHFTTGRLSRCGQLYPAPGAWATQVDGIPDQNHVGQMRAPLDTPAPDGEARLWVGFARHLRRMADCHPANRRFIDREVFISPSFEQAHVATASRLPTSCAMSLPMVKYGSY